MQDFKVNSDTDDLNSPIKNNQYHNHYLKERQGVIDTSNRKIVIKSILVNLHLDSKE